jgi:hypothetical protein
MISKILNKNNVSKIASSRFSDLWDNKVEDVSMNGNDLSLHTDFDTVIAYDNSIFSVLNSGLRYFSTNKPIFTN